MDKKIFLLSIVILIVAAITAGYFIDKMPKTTANSNLTGELATLSANPGADIRTIALCNESDFCQDYKVTCNNGELIEKIPIEHAAVQHEEGWIDSRDIDYSNLCN
jgi:hypothetical protein